MTPPPPSLAGDRYLVSDPGMRLITRVQDARAQGKDQIEVFCPMLESWEIASLDDALRVLSVLVVEPTGREVAPMHGNIYTWFRFRVVETLHQGRVERVSRGIPAAVRPSQSDEIVVAFCGGAVQMNGITLLAHAPVPHFDRGRRYLLFVHMAHTQAAGPPNLLDGLFEVDEGALIPLNGASAQDAIGRALAKQFHSRLSELRAYLRKQAAAGAR